jgi:hypothetical protein
MRGEKMTTENEVVATGSSDAGSTHEEISVATQLIIEYTQRLLAACHATTRLQMRRSLLAGVAAGVLTAGALVSRTFSVGWAPLFGVVSALVGAFIFIGVFSMRAAILTHDEVRLTARGLGVLVRHASAVYEHKAVNFAERLLLEVRLGEAEAALEISTRYGARQTEDPKRLTSPVEAGNKLDTLDSFERIPKAKRTSVQGT